MPTESLVLQPPWVVACNSGLSEEEHLLNKGINHTPAIQDLSEIEAGIGLLGEEAVLLLEPLGVPTIATIEPFNFVSDVDTSLDTLVTVLDDTALALNPMFESLPTETLVSVSEPEIEKTVSLPELNAQQPVAILGHPVIETGDSLHLTSAIDVVFYKGGNAEISGFDLGTDLLWFFLSNEEQDRQK